MTDAKTIALVGAAVAAPYLLDASGIGKKAGAANTAASSYLSSRAVAGVTFAVYPSMEKTWDAMRAALGDKRLSLGELTHLCGVWLGAYEAGCQATTSDAVTDSLHEASTVNFSMVKLPMPGTCAPSHAGEAPCNSEWSSARTPLGNAVCRVLALRDASGGWGSDEDNLGADQQSVYEATRQLAREMDAADYRRDGERASENLDGITALPGAVVSKVTGFVGDKVASVLLSPIVLLAGAALFVAWRVSK